MNGKDFALLALLALVYLAVGLIVPPTDELPHCDDWDYVETARHFLATGHIVYSDWPAMSLLTHVLWGSGFASVFGDSYLVFRSSMFVMSWLGACGIYCWVRRSGWQAMPAFWVAATFALNPLNITYQNSFMTDTTGVTAAIWLGLLLDRSADGTRGSALGVGVFSGIAYLARQTAVVPLISCVVLSGMRWLRTGILSRRIVLILSTFACFVLANWLWMQSSHGVPYATTWAQRRALPPFPELANRISILLLGSALYLAPVTIGWWSRLRFSLSRQGLLAAGGLLVAVVACCGRLPAPYERQEVFDLGVGFSDSIVEMQHLNGPRLEIAGKSVSLFQLATSLIAIGSLVAACQLVAFHVGEWRAKPATDDRQVVHRWLMPLSMAVMVGLLCIVPTMHGRYVWPVAVFALLSLARLGPGPGQHVPLLGAALTITFGAFGLVGIQDNSRCQQAVWAAINDLEAQGIVPFEINGGLEYGGVRRFTPLYRGPDHRGPYLEHLSNVERDRHIALYNPMNIFAPARRYSVTYGPLPNNTIIKEFPFSSWLRNGRIYVLKRNPTPFDGESEARDGR